MSEPTVAVVRTGVANLASVLAGLRRAGGAPRVVNDARSVNDAGMLVLPGVGSFGAAMHELDARRLSAPLAARIRAGRPTLAICLGLQLLASGSDESPDAAGLDVFAGRAARFGADVRVPQLGWNVVAPDDDCTLLHGGCAYYANSYRLTARPNGWRAAWSTHGGPFIAALERGAVLACQFHPELSGAWGTDLLYRWLSRARKEAVTC